MSAQLSRSSEDGRAVRCLLAIKGNETESALQSVGHVLPSNSRITLVHVIDDRAADEVKASREGYILHRQLRKQQVSSMQRADEAGAAGILDRATADLGRGDQEGIERRVLRGHPEREVVQLAQDASFDVVIVFGRRHHGPKSIGKAGRFIVDHVPCTVMVVR